jgi:hypothetical protein
MGRFGTEPQTICRDEREASVSEAEDSGTEDSGVSESAEWSTVANPHWWNSVLMRIGSAFLSPE